MKWIHDELGEETPFHILRFFPSYKYNGHGPPTVSYLEELWQASKDIGLKYVYLGNVMRHKYENTYCPRCGKKVIDRSGFEVMSINLKGRNCAFCGEEINVVV